MEQQNSMLVGLTLSHISLAADFCERRVNFSKGRLHTKFSEISKSPYNDF